ncbi:GNAT family N-acetyltransferase [Paenibacillus sp. sgz5001063]|uniref:GNAT family N-acetyltransferase n=1 Tax=Paenibacillus sp. sgz5001063 TaxID=3242474 RepID=UPI0036D28758
MSNRVFEYDRNSLRELQWPDTDYGRHAQQYISAMLEHPAEHYFTNVRTTIRVVAVDGLPIPITINEAEYTNSYVCSPYTHYVSYAHEELALLNNRLLEGVLAALLRGMGFMLRTARFNRVVQVNNWLLSTNLYPPVNPEQLLKVLDYLRAEYPGYTILLRSLSKETSGPLMDALSGYGCKWVPSRQIYLLQHPQSSKAKWLVKRDRTMLDKQGYTVEPPDRITQEDISRIVELYELLYIHKYSEHNPKFTAAYIRLALEKRTLHIYGLRKNGRLDAVLGFYSREGAMTAPLFGYDTTLPQSIGLYRMLSAVLIDLAESRGELLHESSGVGQFKRNRGAVAATEYSVVLDKGTPWLNRSGWSFLGLLLRRVGIPLIQKLKL